MTIGDIIQTIRDIDKVCSCLDSIDAGDINHDTYSKAIDLLEEYKYTLMNRKVQV